MQTDEHSFPYFTWDCADDLEGRLKKTLYHGGKRQCMGAVSPVALTDLAVSIYVAAAPSCNRQLTVGYIGSVTKRLGINPCTMMLGLLYCERLRQVNPEYLSKISSSDLFVISLVISSKYLTDEGEDDEIFNDEWADAGGLGVSTVNRLEREFLDALHWKAYVSPKEFFHFCNQLETRIALKHGLIRGWFSYTDLSRILAQIQYLETLKTSVQNALQVVVGCSLMYGLSIGVLLSSALCLNASYAKNALTGSHNGGFPADPVHPFADRPVTRTRQTQETLTNDQRVITGLEARLETSAPRTSFANTSAGRIRDEHRGFRMDHELMGTNHNRNRFANFWHDTGPRNTAQFTPSDIKWKMKRNHSTMTWQGYRAALDPPQQMNLLKNSLSTSPSSHAFDHNYKPPFSNHKPNHERCFEEHRKSYEDFRLQRSEKHPLKDSFVNSPLHLNQIINSFDGWSTFLITR